MQTDLCEAVLPLERERKKSEPISVIPQPVRQGKCLLSDLSSACELGHLSHTNLRLLPAAVALEWRKMRMWWLILSI